ncbi:MAG: HNH endonuclease [Acidimicrobiia bacterium]
MVNKADQEWAWDKASKVRGKNPNLYRRDEKGNEMYKPSYGKGGDKSWEVDHRNPKAKGGTDSRRNLRALTPRQTGRRETKGSS